jgi:hypothetical protein
MPQMERCAVGSNWFPKAHAASPLRTLAERKLSQASSDMSFFRRQSWRARQKNWKFILYTELEWKDELYDLQTDSYELNNHFNESSAEPRLKTLQAELAAPLKETAA